MKTIKKLRALTVAIIVMGVGCKHGNKAGDINDKMIGEISSMSHKNLRAYKAIMFVPSEGCGGCISGAENFMINDFIGKGRKGLLFVVTGLDSKKSAQARLGQVVLSCPDVYFDYAHAFDRPPFMGDYPKVIFLQNGEWHRTEEISPETGEKTYKDLSIAFNN